MKFYYTPNESIIQKIVNKQTGKESRFLVCTFDQNGMLETNDDKIIYILQNKLQGCTWEDDKVVTALEVSDILSDDDIRQLAKEKGLKSWHVKKIEKLKEELGV